MTSAERSFRVFGDPVEILVSAEESGGACVVVTQTCAPGGGPPPHSHVHEDEVFTTLEGEFELFDGVTWHPLRQGETHFASRGGVHTFRNCGAVAGKILIMAIPGRLDRYLQAISPLRMPGDVAQLVAISDPYGITFPGLGQAPS